MTESIQDTLKDNEPSDIWTWTVTDEDGNAERVEAVSQEQALELAAPKLWPESGLEFTFQPREDHEPASFTRANVFVGGERLETWTVERYHEPPTVTTAEAALWCREIASRYVAKCSAWVLEIANARERTFDRQTARGMFGAAHALYVASWSSEPRVVDVDETGRVWVWYAGLSEPLEFDDGSITWGDTYIFRTDEHLAADGHDNPGLFDAVAHMRRAKVQR